MSPIIAAGEDCLVHKSSVARYIVWMGEISYSGWGFTDLQRKKNPQID